MTQEDLLCDMCRAGRKQGNRAIELTMMSGETTHLHGRMYFAPLGQDKIT